ncbi:MAG: hypothetical protein KBD78_12825 [Oligoflexales bacterium]|nr:hypothetical protein [Oligoflexales bacterium]
MAETEGKVIRPVIAKGLHQPAHENTSVKEPGTKELWEMTKAEYEATHGQLKTNTTVTGRFSPHKSAVETALNRGLPVPKEVLADYPNLEII